MTRPRKPRRGGISLSRPEIPGVEFLQAIDNHHYFPKHFHDTYCIPLQDRGAMVSLYRNRRNVLTEGDTDLLEPGEVHTSWEGDGSGWSYRCLYLHPDFVAFAGLERGEDRIPALRHLNPRRDRIVFGALSTAHDGLCGGADSLTGETLLTRAVAALLQLCGAEPKAARRNGAEPAHVARVRAYLGDYLGRRITLRELAALVDLNPVYLVRVFRRTTGLPPHRYLRQLRINTAQVLLRRGQPIAEVAAAAGFSDQSHLTRIFRDALGVTPAEYARA